MAADRVRFHQRVYRFLSPVVRVWIGRRFSMTYSEVPELPDHFLLISNHVTNYDMFIVGLTLRAHMYFVSTEHIFRLGLISRIIRFLADPIPIAKGGSTSGAVLEILRRLKAGCSVCLFAEGNCSWDGRTIAFPDATGKMVQKSKAPLVTVRVKGGYFSHPRWAYTHRRGPLRCEVVGIHQPEELAGMKPAEINRLIADEIGEDAYAAQLADPKPYVGKALSRGLERTFLACPKCGRLASIRSTDDGFSCDCGLKGSYDEYGMLSGEGFDFRTVRDWEDWQRGFFAALPDPGEEETLYASDKDMVLYAVSGHRMKESARGDLSCTDRTLRLGSLEFPFSEMSDLAVRLHGTVTFSMKDDSYYELKKADKSDYSGRIYKCLFERFAPDAPHGRV